MLSGWDAARRKIDFFAAIVWAAIFAAGIAVQGQTAEQGWLKYDLAMRIHVMTPIAVRWLGDGSWSDRRSGN